MQWFVVFTFVVMLILGFLGFTNFHERLLINDKALRFLCFALTTGVFYWIVDVEEYEILPCVYQNHIDLLNRDARRIWFWRYASLVLTGFFCFFCGGIVSEIVQSFLPVCLVSPILSRAYKPICSLKNSSSSTLW